MIPKNIKRRHVLSAISEIKVNGIPDTRRPTRYWLLHDGQRFPPKYVISIANRYANGIALPSDTFSGGSESNGFLERIGFEVVQFTGERKRKLNPLRRKTRAIPPSRHNERCPECKVRIEEMLRAAFGEVQTGISLDLGTRPENFVGTPAFLSLSRIFDGLGSLRGQQEFVKAQNLPPVDYFVLGGRFVVEFDESQHFTEPRKEALSLYPDDLDIRFDVQYWRHLCDKIGARDDSPTYRDEQRAWYDTLRDFLPLIGDFGPTVRLYAGDLKWCDLEPSSMEDLRCFKDLLENPERRWAIKVRQDPSPSIARLIIEGEWESHVSEAIALLSNLCSAWPNGIKVDCLMTCGGFLMFDWPKELSSQVRGGPMDNQTLSFLTQKAKVECKLLLDDATRLELSRHTDFLTIGIDSYKEKISLSSVAIRRPHVELVSIMDLEKNRYHWTGKSYPTPGQQDGLARVQDIGSHFINMPFGKLMLLGCHDLTVFNPRGRANAKLRWKKEIREEFYTKLDSERPEVVLHHPHTTDSSRTWLVAWNELSRSAPSVKEFAGAGRYYRAEGVRDDIDKILASTKRGPTLDFIARRV